MLFSFVLPSFWKNTLVVWTNKCYVQSYDQETIIFLFKKVKRVFFMAPLIVQECGRLFLPGAIAFSADQRPSARGWFLTSSFCLGFRSALPPSRDRFPLSLSWSYDGDSRWRNLRVKGIKITSVYLFTYFYILITLHLAPTLNHTDIGIRFLLMWN